MLWQWAEPPRRIGTSLNDGVRLLAVQYALPAPAMLADLHDRSSVSVYGRLTAKRVSLP